MNKIRDCWKNKKGMTLVWGGFFLLIMLMLAGMAIDLSYMYYVKNQLQVAADGAALAGAADLDPLDTTTTQIGARQGAWKIACRNRAATEPVFLVTDEGRDHNSPNCQTPPVSGLNETNDINGDIVIGNWDPTRPSAPVDLRFRPTPGNLLEGTDIINAVKVVPKRTGETPGMPQVRVYLGQIFRLIGINWSFLSARATAIATMPPKASSFVAVGDQFCPLPGNPACVGGTGSTDGATCNLVTARELSAQESASPEDKLGWTSLLYTPGNTNEFADLMCSTSPYQDICPPASIGIWGIPGVTATTFANYSSLMCDPGFDASSKEITSGHVTGWEVLIPVVNRTDPMSAPDPNPVWGYAKIHIIEVCHTGGTGCRGAGSCASAGFCGPGDNKIVIDRISCIACGEEELGLKPALVK